MTRLHLNLVMCHKIVFDFNRGYMWNKIISK